MTMFETDLSGIRLLVLDVDGVMTDGRICLDADGRETKVFHVTDGAGMKYWQRVGREIAIISGRDAPATAHRARELGVRHLRQGVKVKLPVYESILAELGLKPEQTAVMGDDLPDLPLLRHCGLAIAPANAVAEVKQASHLVTRAAGGEGAVREVIEALLRQAGLWEAIMQRYRQETS